jgi:hypothetical protein
MSDSDGGTAAEGGADQGAGRRRRSVSRAYPAGGPTPGNLSVPPDSVTVWDDLASLGDPDPDPDPKAETQGVGEEAS